MNVTIKAIEYYLPSDTEDRNTLKKDNPDWRIEDIEEKTGVLVRHIASPHQTAADMAAIAAHKLFASAVNKEEIGFLILVTQSPDYVLPTTACILQDRLGLKKTCMAFDVNLGCSGFIYGLAIGGALIEAGLAKKGLLLCGDTYSKYIDKEDRTCRSLFSDAASATLLIDSDSSNLGPFEMGTDGSRFSNFIVPDSGARVSDTATSQKQLYMNGADIFMFTMEMVPKCVEALLAKSGKTIDDIDLIVFHQASKLVIDNIIRRLNLPQNKVFNNYEKIGNTVSASIPIALREAADKKKLKNGDLVMMVGFGVGNSWGGCFLRWEVEK